MGHDESVWLTNRVQSHEPLHPGLPGEGASAQTKSGSTCWPALDVSCLIPYPFSGSILDSQLVLRSR